MIIALGCDHGAFELKNIIIEDLKQKGFQTIDCGTNNVDSCDYPDYAEKVCTIVNEDKADLGILICGTGIGMSMAANKISGIRCALCGDVFSAKATRSHNDANVLALGARVVGVGLALEIVHAYLDTPFSNEQRHMNRVDKITKLEK